MLKGNSRLLQRLTDDWYSGRISPNEFDENFLDSMEERPDDYNLSDKQELHIIRMNERYPPKI